MGNSYVRYALTGGTDDALDAIDGGVLKSTDFAIVIVPSVAGSDPLSYIYLFDPGSGLAESSPDIIAPDTNPGNGRWILQNIYTTGGGTGAGGFTGILLDANDIGIANCTSGTIVSLIDPQLLLLESGSFLLQECGREIFTESA